MINAEITGWGKCMPPNVLSNHDLEQIVDTTDEWITTRTGIKERRISHVDTSEMAYVAGMRALSAAGKTPEDIDLLIVATCSGDSIIPSTASIVQKKLGASGAAAMDLNSACSGFVYSMVVASNMIKGGANKTALLIGAEKLHYVTDYTDRATCILFGDGAGAVVMEATEEPHGVMATDLGNDGTIYDLLQVPKDGTMGEPGQRDPQMQAISMQGQGVFKQAVTGMAESATISMGKAGVGLEDVDLLIPHQANVRIIDATARRLGLDDSKVFVNIHSYGNTSGATIPVALTEALEQGRIQPGSTVVFAAFGAGMSWGSMVYKWGSRVDPLATPEIDLPPTDQTTMDILSANFDFFGMPEKLA